MTVTHKDKKCIDIVRKVGCHVFVMAQDNLLNVFPAFKRIGLQHGVHEWFDTQRIRARVRHILEQNPACSSSVDAVWQAFSLQITVCAQNTVAQVSIEQF